MFHVKPEAGKMTGGDAAAVPAGGRFPFHPGRFPVPYGLPRGWFRREGGLAPDGLPAETEKTSPGDSPGSEGHQGTKNRGRRIRTAGGFLR